MPDDTDWTPDYGAPQVSEHDREVAGIPIYDWLSGAESRRNAALEEYDRQKADHAWLTLLGNAPAAGDLTPTYSLEGTSDAYGDLLGGPSALVGAGDAYAGDQSAALAALRNLYESGGYTAADHSMRRANQAMQAQQMGAANRAALSQMEARGTGGSGAALASQLAGSQSLANANAMSDAAIQQQSMMRALAAMQGAGSLATGARGQDLSRAQALDQFNQSNMDWRRGRESRNTAWQNQQQDANTRGRQQAWDNQARGVQGLTNRYPDSDRDRDTSSDQAAAAGVGTLLTEIL